MYSNKYDKIVGRWTGNTYVLLKRLGAGGIGEIYLVQDQAGRLYALKLSTDIISITKEYKFLDQFREKGFIPQVYDLDDFLKGDTVYHFFTMEYIEGYNLKTAAKDKTLTIKTKLNLIRIITRIIIQINEAGYIYTDLKHENIMIDGKNNLIRLIDLGSLVELGSTVKEYTPMYDRLCWGKGGRIADKHYQVFVIAILFLSLVLNRSFDPNREQLDAAVSALKRKLVPQRIFNIIEQCIGGRILDCNALYNEISCVADGKLYADGLKTALNITIFVLFFLLTVTIFAFCR